METIKETWNLLSLKSRVLAIVGLALIAVGIIVGGLALLKDFSLFGTFALAIPGILLANKALETIDA